MEQCNSSAQSDHTLGITGLDYHVDGDTQKTETDVDFRRQYSGDCDLEARTI